MRRGGWIFGMVLLAALNGAPADPWLRFSSPNFELFTTASERSGRDLIKHFERVRSFFQQAFGLIPSDGNPVQVIAFRTAREYEPYKLNEVASAYFQPAVSHDFIVMESASAEHYPVAVHEYTHLLLHQTGKAPRWLNEGLAELYSNLEPRGGEILVGRVIPGRAAMLQTEKWLDLHDVVSVDERSPLYNEKTHAGMFYAESWFLVHMLALQEWYAPRFRQLGAALAEGDTASAFLKVYGKTLGQVQQDLELYFHSPTLSGRLFNVQLPGSVDAPHVERGGFRARVALAEVLNGIPNRRAAAHDACEALERDFPNQRETERRWAEFYWRDRSLDESARHFAKAIALGPDDSRLYRDYGRVLASAGRHQEAVDALKKADSPFELAVALVQNGSFRDALAAFNKVRNLPPDQAIRYYYNTAYAHFRLGDTAGAKKLLDQAAPFVKSDRDRRAIEDLRTACCR
jgi:hypothetical protein